MSLSNELDNVCNNEEFRKHLKDFSHVPESELNMYIGWSKKRNNEIIKESITRLKDKIIENDIYTADEIFRIINEEFGDKLNGVGKQGGING